MPEVTKLLIKGYITSIRDSPPVEYDLTDDDLKKIATPVSYTEMKEQVTVIRHRNADALLIKSNTGKTYMMIVPPVINKKPTIIVKTRWGKQIYTSIDEEFVKDIIDRYGKRVVYIQPTSTTTNAFVLETENTPKWVFGRLLVLMGMTKDDARKVMTLAEQLAEEMTLGDIEECMTDIVAAGRFLEKVYKITYI